MTKSSNYKLIMVRGETLDQLKQLAGNDQKISAIISHLVKKEIEEKNNDN